MKKEWETYVKKEEDHEKQEHREMVLKSVEKMNEEKKRRIKLKIEED